MPSAKRVLGRGLADLIPVGGDGANSPAGTGVAPDLGPGQELSIAQVHPNPRQPRTVFDEAALIELAESVKANGILQPILVRPRTAGGYEIVAGERRYRAALRAGLKKVPVVVRPLTDEETLALALIENLIREDIGPMETARAFRRLMDDFGWTQEEMGRRVGKSRAAVANTLRLLLLPEPIQESLEMGQLTEGHVRALIGDEKQRALPDFRDRQIVVWKQILLKNLSVREVERLMKAEREGDAPAADVMPGDRTLTFTADAGPAPKDTVAAPPPGLPSLAEVAERRALEDRLRSALGAQVRLAGTMERGRIEIEFFSAAELDDLLARFESAPVTPAEAAHAAVGRSVGHGPGLLPARRSA